MEDKTRKEFEKKLYERTKEIEIRTEISKYMEKIGYVA